MGGPAERLPRFSVFFYDSDVSRSIYDKASTVLAAKRDGWTFDNRLGVSADFKDRLSGEVSVGQLRRTYDDASLDNILTTSYGAAITYQVGNNASLEVNAGTALSPATIPGERQKLLTVCRLRSDSKSTTGWAIAFRRTLAGSITKVVTARRGNLGLGWKRPI